MFPSRLINLKIRNASRIRRLRCAYATQIKDEYVFPKPEDDYTEYPQYPVPVAAKDKGTENVWYEKIKRQKTIEEKLFEINVPRYWGWKCLLLKEGQVPYDNLHFVQYATRTHLIESTDLPPHYQNSTEKCSKLAREIKSRIEESVVDSTLHTRLNRTNDGGVLDEEKEVTRRVVNQLNRVILKALKRDERHLQMAQIDYSPRQESFWKLGSLVETYKPPIYKEGLKPGEIPEEYLGRPSNKYVQYIGEPILQMRMDDPLPPFMEFKEATYFKYPFPSYDYDPFITFGYEMVRRHVTNIPGFWPGESREFGYLSYHDSNFVKHRPEAYGANDVKETLQCQAILSSFAWLMALTSYQGFSTFHDITYPFVTQTILTDGKNFSFAVYQLNTTELHHKNRFTNPLSNICWLTPQMPLFETIQDGVLKGVNENVIRLLLHFYTNKPDGSRISERKPYLDKNLGVVANYEDEEKRAWLEQNFKHFSANRPFHRVDKMYEPDDYERIYHIQFKRFLTRRTRPFQLRENPYLRKMSERAPTYIPRALRPDKHLPKWKQQKFEKTYYPK